MKARKPQRARELARIHILAGELRLTRDQYEAVLLTHGHQESSRDLDEHGRRLVIDHLERLVSERRVVTGDPPRNLDRPLMRKIRAQLAELGKGWGYAYGTAKNMFDKRLDFCSDDELRRLVAALAIHINRGCARRERTD